MWNSFIIIIFRELLLDCGEAVTVVTVDYTCYQKMNYTFLSPSPFNRVCVCVCVLSKMRFSELTEDI